MGLVRTGGVRRIAVALAAVACVVTTTSCTSGGSSAGGAASSSSGAEAGTYLALGDSVPFGYRAAAGAEFADAKNFVGYPELIGKKSGYDVVNASCPGETTSSFLDVTAQSNGCESTLKSPTGYRTAYPLHVLYSSVKQSQLEYAVKTLKDKHVDLITLQIGANDAFVCQQTTADACTSTTELEAVGQKVLDNIDTILKTLRTDSGYKGKLVVVTYYALNYSDPTGAAIQGLDSRIAEIGARYGAQIADGYAAFKPAAEKAGGDSIEAGLVLPNDVHPTDEGQQLLADAVTAAAGS